MKNSPMKGLITMMVNMADVTVTHSMPTTFMITAATTARYLIVVVAELGKSGNISSMYCPSMTMYS
jgi:hypothetical protein